MGCCIKIPGFTGYYDMNTVLVPAVYVLLTFLHTGGVNESHFVRQSSTLFYIVNPFVIVLVRRVVKAVS
jgi:hypothetical protein